MPEKLTIQDIARLAGVSKATVSRVLNHNPSVSPETEARVMRIVEKYDFVPNVTATGLAGGKTRLLGVLAPPLTWAGISEILRGVAEYVEDTSYEIVLYSISFDRDHSDVLDRILSMRMVSGLLAILPGKLSRHITERFHQGLPLVMIDDQEEPGIVPWVGIDNVSSAYQATRHLLDLGHRRIAYIHGPQHYYCTAERYQGYAQALQDAGIAPDPTLVFQGRFDTPSGRECATEIFSRDKSAWPSAIFAGNDQMAYGVLQVAEQRGIQIPESIALVGFDDDLLAEHLRPPLTTIHQPFSQMGYKAIELLLTMVDPDHRAARAQRKGDVLPEHEPVISLEDVQADHPIRILLPTSLVIRASSGAPQSLSVGS
ncbi:MAG TPA: LacI family DNA-binding transcriptional regulator [Ktedonobacteraceae bacterium]|nr:LacI family DNA-binding transcriptional regulator [Ktedonobacteraceae bacterium]